MTYPSYYDNPSPEEENTLPDPDLMQRFWYVLTPNRDNQTVKLEKVYLTREEANWRGAYARRSEAEKYLEWYRQCGYRIETSA